MGLAALFASLVGALVPSADAAVDGDVAGGAGEGEPKCSKSGRWCVDA
jgi:hypothetical protein